ncbi:unnamed protein product [Owenia fusiformis]|uniref:Uncharacterized protein n=1 Tax=Owenia fusiformis TaxID=6347 RepID=A0A8S4Q9P4_OWEFU|nr:unnamed protein product [Owenia fusiformis]
MAQNKQNVIVRYNVGESYFVAAVQQKKSFYMWLENEEATFSISEMCLRNLCVKEEAIREEVEKASFLPVEVEIGTGIRLYRTKGIVWLQRFSDKSALKRFPRGVRCFRGVENCD